MADVLLTALLCANIMNLEATESQHNNNRNGNIVSVYYTNI